MKSTERRFSIAQLNCSQASWRKWLRLALRASLLSVAGLSSITQAAPIRYTLSFNSYFLNPAHNIAYEFSVELGANVYTGSMINVELTFTGDDSDVHTGNSPVAFAEIHQGTATVSILDGTQVLQDATFLPGQLAVTADQSNNGFGFGFVPGGAGPGPLDLATLQPLYPAAISSTFVGDPTPDQFYDLTLAYAQAHAGNGGTGFSYGTDGSALLHAGLWSCFDFQGSFASPCTFPAAGIPTDQGDFSIIGDIQPWYAVFRDGPLPIGTFTATPLAVVPEPGTLALLGIALAGVAATRKRRSARR